MLLFLFRLPFFEDPSLQRERESKVVHRENRLNEDFKERKRKLSKSHTHYPRGKLMRAKKGFERKKEFELGLESSSPLRSLFVKSSFSVNLFVSKVEVCC